MADLPELGGAGGVGALLGAVLTWAGFKSRLDAQDARIKAQDERMTAMEKEMVSPQKCEERGKQCNGHFDGIESLLGEMRADIKALLSKVTYR